MEVERGADSEKGDDVYVPLQDGQLEDEEEKEEGECSATSRLAEAACVWCAEFGSSSFRIAATFKRSPVRVRFVKSACGLFGSSSFRIATLTESRPLVFRTKMYTDTQSAGFCLFFLPQAIFGQLQGGNFLAAFLLLPFKVKLVTLKEERRKRNIGRSDKHQPPALSPADSGKLTS